MNNTPTNELSAFLLAVSTHGNQHLSAVEADLQQTKYLLNEAIEKLGAGFANVHQLVASQQAIVNSSTHFSTEQQQQLQQLEADINQEMNAVVTSMQFQDMTNQLLQKTIKQVNGLSALLNTLPAHEHEMPAKPAYEDMMDFLASAHASLNQSSEALTGGLRKSVDQTNMSTGDIDLF